MSQGKLFFIQNCPTCRRRLQIKLAWLGRRVRCQHCQREFTARDPNGESAALDERVDQWLQNTHQMAPDQVEFAPRPR